MTDAFPGILVLLVLIKEQFFDYGIEISTGASLKIHSDYTNYPGLLLKREVE